MKLKEIVATLVIILCLTACHRFDRSFESSLNLASLNPLNFFSSDTIQEVTLFPEEYVAWVNDPANKLSVQKSISGFTYQLEFEPLELIALQRLKDSSISVDLFEEEKRNLGNIQYYTLGIGTPDETSIIKYRTRGSDDEQHRANYFAFEMQNDVRLVDGADTLQCLMYHYENNYGLLPLTNFLLAFNNPDSATFSARNKTLIVNNRIFAHESVTLSVTAEDLQRIPKLGINSSEK